MKPSNETVEELKDLKGHKGHTLHEDFIAKYQKNREVEGDVFCHECHKPVKLFIKDLPDEIRRPNLALTVGLEGRNQENLLQANQKGDEKTN